MTHPLGYYTSYDPLNSSPAPLCVLVHKFGDYLQRLSKNEKLMLLAIISHGLAFNENPDTEGILFGLNEAWAELDYNLSPELAAMLEPLNTLSDGDLLGICQTLIANYDTAEVAA